MDELLLTLEVDPSFSTNALLTDRHPFQVFKSSKQEFVGRWHSPQILLIPMLKGLETRDSLIIDLVADWKSAKLVQIS